MTTITKNQVLNIAKGMPNYKHIAEIIGDVSTPWRKEDIQKIKDACSGIYVRAARVLLSVCDSILSELEPAPFEAQNPGFGTYNPPDFNSISGETGKW